ncbi:MAG: hypothetical protein OEM84_13040 [Acidimicrobiia bacterium]|nr:hypothetical protein [Acidimicrobiia bacterium]
MIPMRSALLGTAQNPAVRRPVPTNLDCWVSQRAMTSRVRKNETADRYDLVIIGGRAGGLSVAISSRQSGLERVRIIEPSSEIAFSGRSSSNRAGMARAPGLPRRVSRIFLWSRPGHRCSAERGTPG